MRNYDYLVISYYSEHLGSSPSPLLLYYAVYKIRESELG